MDITPQIPKNKNNITSYGPEGFKINQTIYKNSLILSPDKLLKIEIKNPEEINLDILKQILTAESEVLLIGTGAKHLRLPENIRHQIKNSFPLISIDEMSSAAACRTYNILITEDRNVVAVLMMI
jgi:uncharacterized protein